MSSPDDLFRNFPGGNPFLGAPFGDPEPPAEERPPVSLSADVPCAETPAIAAAERDFRLYAPYPEGWDVRIKRDWERDYCFRKRPGEDYFHLLQNGEIYMQRGTERYCLNCSVKMGILSEDRLHWQHRPSPPPPPSIEGL